MTNIADADAVADLQRLRYPDPTGDLDRLVEFLRTRCPGGRVLEFGVGTGRVALPLAAAGFHVTGIDKSPTMLRKLAELDPEERVVAQEADFIADDLSDADFDVVLMTWNAPFHAATLDDQVALFENAARSLASDGFVLVETTNPLWFVGATGTGQEGVHMRQASSSSLLEQLTIDPVRQTVHADLMAVGPQGTVAFRENFRWMTPFEMDAVARLAGLEVETRAADWTGAPYTRHAARCISTYIGA